MATVIWRSVASTTRSTPSGEDDRHAYLIEYPVGPSPQM
jgi:hypothetical protein